MTQPPKKARPLWKRVVQKILAALLAVVLVAVFYLAVVLGQPQDSEDTVEAQQNQPLLAASPARSITEEAALSDLVAEFPVPVMSMIAGAGPTFTKGMSYDVAFENGFARIVELSYRTAEGVELKVQSIYPARALSLVGKGDYHLSSVSGQAIAGLRSVRMEDATSLRLHAQASDAIYVFIAPISAADTLGDLTRTLQLSAAKTAAE